MGYPYTQLLGDVRVSVTATAAAAVSGTLAQDIGISLGLPVIEQIADIAVRFKIPRSLHLKTTSRPAYKITYRGNDLNPGLTFAAQGVHSGDSIVLADA